MNRIYKNTRRIVACLVAFIFSGGILASDGAPKSNVLFIIVDDLATLTLAAHPGIETPALDKLASRGFRFVNNFANVPVCGASRASMLSGLAPSAERFLTYNSRLDEDAPEVTSLPAFFKDNGWYTLANGKVFDVIADSAQSWSEPVWNPEPQWHSNQEVDGRGEHLQKAYLEPVRGARPPTFESKEVEDSAYPDGQIALKAIADLQRLAESSTPFFMAVGFRKPHLPFNAPSKYWTDDLSELSLPPSWQASLDTIPAEALHRSAELRLQYDALPLLGEATENTAKQIIAGYYAATRFADQQVGLVLEALDNYGLSENTVVVLSGDHGFLLGEQRMWTKHALFEPALRTPLIIAAPSLVGGEQVTAISDLLDVFPTLAELSGLPAPAHLDGYSLVSLMQNPSLAARAEKPGSVSRWMNGVSLRNAKYRYTRWYDKDNNTLAEMLFDVVADSSELQNIARSPEMANRMLRFKTQLDGQAQTAQWSEALEKNIGRMKVVNSGWGGYLMLGMVYPIQTILGLLCALVLLGVITKRALRTST